MRDVILAVSIALSTATQLRAAGVPLGAAEAGFAVWIALTSVMILIDRAHPNPAVLLRFVGFWSLFAFALSVGACIGYVTDDKLNVPDLWHDSVAYLLMAVTTCLAAATIDGARSLRRIEWLLVTFSAAGLLLQILAGWAVLPSFGFDPWYWDRFRGWSENPNQLALFCAAIALLSLHLATQSARGPRVLALLCTGVALLTGRLTKSDTFVVAMTAAGLVLVVLQLRSWMTIREKVSLRYAAALGAALFILPFCASLAPYALSDSLNIKRFAFSFAKEKGSDATEVTADLRLRLWKSALYRGWEAAGLGLGPGPHLDRPVGVKSLPDPFEAHSTVLDTFLQGGMVATIALVWLIASAGVAAYNVQLNTLVALVCAIVIFSIPHLVIRQPIVWMSLVICFLARPAGRVVSSPSKVIACAE